MKLESIEMDFPGECKVLLITATNAKGLILGSVCLKTEGTEVAEFFLLFVRKEYRRQGIAKRLLDHAGMAAALVGRVALSGCVNPNNSVAQLFYRNLGFNTTFQFSDGRILVTRSLRSQTAKTTQTARQPK